MEIYRETYLPLCSNTLLKVPNGIYFRIIIQSHTILFLKYQLITLMFIHVVFIVNIQNCIMHITSLILKTSRQIQTDS